ncbi:glycosyltransferase [Thalassotalea sp. 1_MG-2023]|uniref:glycosyltransferase n=1 Tax=Thalassotalea sp. 1_MG-2023 TaxID=3062680 RepID=UPI0026E4117E|nr:glycosyltransferase [Thalassotalea sp. 1_MG-2023]MDO6425532.1 glycosyltransferase [Thalassotalea sp. 1_MG-2023]
MNNNKVRVLHIFANLNLGGAESRIMDLFRSQSASDVQNDFLIMTDEECYYSTEVAQLGGIIHTVHSPREGLFKNMVQVYRLFKKTPKYDAIHAHTSYYSGFLAFIAWLAGIKFRVTHARNKLKGRNSIASSVFFFIGRTLCNIFSTQRLAISPDAGQFLYGKKANFTVVPNAFDYGRILHKSALSREQDRAHYKLSSKAIHIVCVARFYAVKNHQFLLDIAKEMQNKHINAVFHLIGDGELRDQVTNSIKLRGLEEYFVFWGIRQDVFQLLYLFDLAIMPSFSEGLGVAALEAQAAGLPCVLSTGIPKSADIGLDLCHFKSLEHGAACWLKSILAFVQQPVVEKCIIDEQFAGEGYNIEVVRDKYRQAYIS